MNAHVELLKTPFCWYATFRIQTHLQIPPFTAAACPPNQTICTEITQTSSGCPDTAALALAFKLSGTGFIKMSTNNTKLTYTRRQRHFSEFAALRVARFCVLRSHAAGRHYHEFGDDRRGAAYAQSESASAVDQLDTVRGRQAAVAFAAGASERQLRSLRYCTCTA